MRIPHTALAPDTLRNLIEEFVTREGTDYGDREYSLADKVRQVEGQLGQGVVVIVYDPQTQSCHILPREQLPDPGREEHGDGQGAGRAEAPGADEDAGLAGEEGDE